MLYTRYHASRGASLLEFVLIIPFAVALMFLTVDVGRLALVSTSLQDAAAVAARSAARQGFAGEVPASGQGVCESTVATRNPAYDSFCDAARRIPGAEIQSFTILAPTTRVAGLGRTCVTSGGRNDVYVTVRASARLELLTPGLSTVLGSAPANLGDTVSAVGTARCEVAR